MTTVQPGSGRTLVDAGVGSGWGWFVTLGVALLVLGVLAFGDLLAATSASVLFVGAMTIVGAVAQLIRAFQVKGSGGQLFWLLGGLLYGAASVITLADLELAVVALTQVLAIALIASSLPVRYHVDTRLNRKMTVRDAEGLDRYSPYALAALRIVAALIFMEHGTQKLFGFPAPPESGRPLAFSLFWLAGVLEFVGGLLVLVGLVTRPVAFLLAGEMAVAYWMFHAPQSFFPVLNGGDAAILYCFVFLLLVFTGPGAWSVDGARAKAGPQPAFEP